MNLFKERLIQNLKYYRKLRNLSQSKLAEACSLSANYIGEIEMGRKFPSADTMLKFVTVLQIPPEGLFKQIQEPDTATDFQRYTAAYAAQLSNALISYVSESLGYYSGRQTLSGSKPDENQL